MSTEKKVKLVFEVESQAAAAGLRDLSSSVEAASRSTNKLAEELIRTGKLPHSTPTGGGLGSVYGPPTGSAGYGQTIPGVPYSPGAANAVGTASSVANVYAIARLSDGIVSLNTTMRDLNSTTKSLSNKSGGSGLANGGVNINQLREIFFAMLYGMMNGGGGGGSGNYLGSGGYGRQLLLGTDAPNHGPGFGRSLPTGFAWNREDGMHYRPEVERTMYGNAPGDPKAPGRMSVVMAAAQRGVGSFALRAAPVVAGLEAASTSWNAAWNADLASYKGASYQERLRAGAESTWVTRQALGFSDSLRGRPQEFAKLEYDEQFRQIQQRGREEMRLFENQVRAERSELVARRDVLAGDRRVATLSPTDRMTVAGQRDYERQLTRQPFEQAVIDSQKELKIAEVTQAERLKTRDQLQKRLSGLEGDQIVANNAAKVEEGKDKFAIQQHVLRMGEEIESGRKELVVLEQDIEKARANIVQLGGNVKMAKVQRLQGEVSILERGEAVAQGQAQRLGRMNALEFASAEMAVNMVRQYGVDGMSSDILSQAEAANPEMMNELYGKRGAARARGKVGQWTGFDDNLTDVQNKVFDAKDQLANALREAQAEIAKGFADNLKAKEFVDSIKSLINAEIDIAIRQLKKQTEAGITRGQQ